MPPEIRPVAAEDAHWMRRALVLARRGRTHPNPRVGAVIVQNGRVIGEGFHRGVGTPHAEAAALAASHASVQGATMYVTLEPCSFTSYPDGRLRVPCSQRCIDAGVSRVVVAMVDPDTRVAGRGIAQLRDAGISVTVGVEESTALGLNVAYSKHRTTGLPYILHKAAMTLDGKIAASGGDARWVTGEKARFYTHRALRHRADAIVIGIGTVLADDPELTTRLPGGNGQNPQRVIIDSRLRTPITAKVVRPGTWIVAAEEQADPQRAAALGAAGVEVILLPAGSEGSGVDVSAVARLLAERDKLLVLLEGGGELAAAFWQAKLIDKVIFFIAPKVIGGRDATTPVEGAGLSRSMADAAQLGTFQVRRFGQDIALEGEVKR